MSFESYELDPRCLRILRRQRITEPTPVQAQAIPPALEGRDVAGVAQTGTGKTLAFALPALTRLAEQPAPRNQTRMLVLTPTRELARQVHEVAAPFAETLGLRSAVVFGGVGMQPQVQALRRGADVVIATPGRLLDHIARGNTRFGKLSVLVFDEADRMLDMGFLPDIRRIVKGLPEARQTLMFSATFPKEIRGLAQDFQRDPVRVEVTPAATTVDSVRQGVYTVDSKDKMTLLARVLEKPAVKSAIVFIRTKHRTDRVAKNLSKQGFHAAPIHGGRSQNQRDRALDRFRRGAVNVLVATDVAARGIDIKGVTHVVNYDIPPSFDDYVHRIGRTARAQAVGDAITFVCPQDSKDLEQIERGLGSNLPREDWEGAVPVHTRSAAPKPAQSKSPRNGGARRRRPRPSHRSRRPQTDGARA